MVHISEVSPGRIRNLRDFVSIDRQIVCKILSVNKEKGYIDLSLRRVNSTQRREKLDEIKTELKAENLISNLAKKLHQNVAEVYREISKPILKDYSYLFLCFKDVASGEVHLADLGVKKELAQELEAAIIDKFKPKKIILKGEIQLKTYHPNGLDKVKSILQKINQISDTISLTYLGAGRYKFAVEDFDYKPAEQTIKKIQDLLEEFSDKVSEMVFIRDKNE